MSSNEDGVFKVLKMAEGLGDAAVEELCEQYGLAEEDRRRVRAAVRLRRCAERLPEVGDRVGDYVLLEQVGSGGAKVVFRAARTEGYGHIVALKFFRSEVLDDSLIARGAGPLTEQIGGRNTSGDEVSRVRGSVISDVLLEADRMAKLNHPGIEVFHEAHQTSSGAPYLRTEYLPGHQIDRYCARHGLDLRARIGLFLDICAAVGHAHRRLVIHCDLKPNNVLAWFDREAGCHRVKLLDFGIAQLLGSGSRVTGLTPDYASPEQLQGRESLDVRTDVYSLGVVLYQLITGRLPLRGDSGNGQDGPVPPSSVAVDPEALGRAPMPLSRAGDLDAILLRALARDPDDRYGSVDELADDLTRFLGNFPVAARRGGPIYRGQKLLRRRWVAFAVASVVAAVMAAGLYVERSGELRRAAISDFFIEILGTPDPTRDGSEIRVVEVLERASGEIPDRFEDQPRLVFDLRTTLGETYYNLGQYDQCAAEFELAVASAGGRKQEFASLSNLAACQYQDGEPSRAAESYGRAFELVKVASSEDRLMLLTNYGVVTMGLGDHVKAASILEGARDALSEAEDPSEQLRDYVENNLAFLYRRTGKYSEAEVLFRTAYERAQIKIGEDHPRTLGIAANLAGVMTLQGRLQEARDLHEMVLDQRRRKLNDHVDVWVSMVDLGRVCVEMGDLERGRDLLEEAVSELEEELGRDHRDTLTAMHNLGGCYAHLGRFEEAVALLEEVVAKRVEVAGTDDIETAKAQGMLGFALMAAGQAAEAEKHLRQAVATMRLELPAENPILVETTSRWTEARSDAATTG